jgi:hypothetical protein
MARESEPVPSILVTSPLEEFQSTVIPSILVTSPLEEFHSTVIPSILLSRELHPEDEQEDTSSNHFRYWFLGTKEKGIWKPKVHLLYFRFTRSVVVAELRTRTV